jgi:uncharacterized membrane protein YsdA (DUF1294 family)
MPPRPADQRPAFPPSRANRAPTDDVSRLTSGHFLTLALLLVLPISALVRLAPQKLALVGAGWGVLTSALCYGLYAWDKRRARRDEWRIAENTLHLCEALGGWPGAFLAQRRLRHKCAKAGYLAMFWLIVVAHLYVALDWQLDWRLARLVFRIV